jgi:hypothetical protein
LIGRDVTNLVSGKIVSLLFSPSVNAVRRSDDDDDDGWIEMTRHKAEDKMLTVDRGVLSRSRNPRR